MLYLMRDACDLMLTPARMAAGLAKTAYQNPFSPLAYTPSSRAIAASCELFERGTRSYAKPRFGLPT
ncbi:polyhydroxyalkanoate depolymerase, partial [Mesorhizobium sp. M1A.T.Ca.IN.004.03.1.1]